MITLDNFNAGATVPAFYDVEQSSDSAFQEAPVISNGHPLAMQPANISAASAKGVEPRPDSPLNDW